MGYAWLEGLEPGAAGRRRLFGMAVHALIGRIGGGTPFAVTGLAFGRTRHGAPWVRRHGVLAAWARDRGLMDARLCVSNTDERGVSLAVCAMSPDVMGIGVDLVRVARMAPWTDSVSRYGRFVRRMCGADEATEMLDSASGQPADLLLAAAFARREAASKALGVGLRLGAGYNSPTALRMSELAATPGLGEAYIVPGPLAAARIRALRGRRMATVAAAGAGFVAAVAFLLR